MNSVKERLEIVQSRIQAAAQRSGRPAESIALVAVTKGVPIERVTEARDAGLLNFGENRVQEAETKIPLPAAPEVQWHMIGHLQSNKIKTALSLFHLIGSVDSVRLAKAISAESLAQGKVMPVLLEVNISGAPQRFGFTPAEVYGALDKIARLPSIRVMGLMGIAPHKVPPEKIRESFKTLKNIFSVCKTLKKENLEMKYLSMGMSDDFEIAIEEGSNMVRLGRALFQ